MANFTTTTRTICEMLTGKTTPISTVITEAAPLFFNFNFPFYNEEKRAEFEQNFLRHFYMREIGLETIDYFMLRLEDKLNTIMPYYNKLLMANEKEYNPFYNEIIDETITRDRTGKTNGTDTTATSGSSTTKGNSTNTTTSSADDNNQQSDLPQGSLANFNDNSYMSSAGKGHTESNSSVTSTDETTGTNSGSSNTTRAETSEGNETEKRTANNVRGNQSEMLRMYYEAQRNILDNIFNDCEDLYMGLWC
nr:MAG TPA: Lower collar protein [Caudoviricetes sp.]